MPGGERDPPPPIVDYRAGAERLRRTALRWRVLGPLLVYATVACAATKYLNGRADIAPKWGEWYGADVPPYIFMQVRAFFSGRLALLPHPAGAGPDYFWGRGGMHFAWGLGVPILSTPFYLVGRLFGAPGFPEGAEFLILYAVTTFVLARALHRASRDEPTALVASAAAAGFVMVFPTYVGMVSSRFQIYELTIAMGALWSLLQLSGILLLVRQATPGRLIAVCVVAGFAATMRPTLIVYGLTTATIALILANRQSLRPRALLAGFAAYVATTGLYFAGNVLRFGSLLSTGYENCVSGSLVNRLTRWGLSFAKVPFVTAAKEMFATLFLLDPVPVQIMMGTPPASVQPYVVGERWREYYAPTFDRLAFAVWAAALGIVGWRIVRHRLWRRDADLRGEVRTIVGAWALPPSIVLFVFYARVGNLVTRYATDLYPAFAAAFLCVGMATVEAARRRGPGMAASAQLALACAAALYISGWRGWATHLSRPVDRKTRLSRIAEVDARARDMPLVPNHFSCKEPRGAQPVHNHLEDWSSDCSFDSAMVFAMPSSPCVAFTLRTNGVPWGPLENESLRGFRASADFDKLVSCGGPTQEGDARRVTMCDPHPPPFVVDGLRLYAVASLNANLDPIDRLKLMRIDSVGSCP